MTKYNAPTQTTSRNIHSNQAPQVHQALQQIVSEVKGRYRLTMFRPRHDASYNGKVVDETKFLGSFKSANNVSWLRLSACVAVNPDSQQKAQWGRILAYRGLVAPLVKAITESQSGRFVTLNIDARMQVVINNGFANTVWTIYGFEYNNQYFTTKNGELTVGPILSEDELRAKGGNNTFEDGDNLFAQTERELGGVANAAGHMNTQALPHRPVSNSNLDSDALTTSRTYISRY